MFIQLKKIRGALFILALLVANCCSAQFGGTYTFDGTTQSVATPNGMLNTASVFTIEFWIKTTENRTSGTFWQRPTMVGVVTNGNASGDLGITSNNGYIAMFSGLNNGGDQDFLSATLKINDNAWHHIAAVDNGTLIRLFVDGNLQGSLPVNIGLQTNTAPLTIGATSLDFGFTGNVGTSNFFHAGIYDEVRFSNSVRYTTNFTVPSSAFTSDANTIALYHLDGACVGGLVPDASSNSNNAHPHNFTGSCAFTLPATPTIPATDALVNINKAEYFYDTDPGFGNGTDIPVTASTDINQTSAVNTASLTNGVHRLFVRTRDLSNHWSLTNYTTFFIVPPIGTIPATQPLSRILKAEYFYDTDPGFGAGTNIPITATYDLNGTFPVNTSALTNGVHRIFVRTQDSTKSWSLTNFSSFYVLQSITTIPANPAAGNVVKAEYYMDTDPGFGNATDIPLTASNDVTINNTLVSLVGLSNGVHHVYVRTKSSNGAWSLTNNGVFSIIAASFSLPPNPVPGNITKFEYFFDTDPGFGNGHIVSITPTTDLNNYTFAADVSSLNDSTHTLYIRTFDGWSITNTRSFIKGSVTPVTWLSFNAKLKADSVLLNWSTATELNNARYEIQRSADGNSFVTIGSMNGSGTSSLQHDYTYTDKNPLPGVSYYRIRQVDLDGRSTYSVVIAIRFGAGNILTNVYPNPAKSLLHLQFGGKEKNVQVNIFDASGKLVLSENKSNQPVIDINITKLIPGTYYLQVSDGLVAGKTKFIKE
ncbi:MAG: LamG-like jellyroll fold domain-containing protein [Ferruginibacter sp.]